MPVEQEKKLTTSDCFFFSLYVDWCFSDALHIYIYTYVWRFFFFLLWRGRRGGASDEVAIPPLFAQLGLRSGSVFSIYVCHYYYYYFFFLPCFSVPFPGVTACNDRSCVKRPNVQHFFFFFLVSALLFMPIIFCFSSTFFLLLASLLLHLMHELRALTHMPSKTR